MAYAPFCIEGNFDDAQTGVKKIFVNEEICKKEENGMTFSSANPLTGADCYLKSCIIFLLIVTF